MRAKWGWLAVGLVVAAGAAAFVAQHRRVVALREEVGRERAAARTLDDARAERGRLRAAQPATGELEQAGAAREALVQARAEVEALRRKAEAAARAEAESNARPAERFAVGRTVPAGEWKNAGTATAAAALETALWAGAGGDVEAFAGTLRLMNDRVKKDAGALRESLPDAMRGEYDSPERLIAFLSVKDVPLGAVQVRQSSDLQSWPDAARQLRVLLTGADGKQKDATLLFMNSAGGWRLVVTESVVAKYAAQLKSPVSAAAGK